MDPLPLSIAVPEWIRCVHVWNVCVFVCIRATRVVCVCVCVRVYHDACLNMCMYTVYVCVCITMCVVRYALLV